MTDSQSAGARGKALGRARASRARRGEILDAARALFLERGYAATSVSAIVRAAGVAQGTFYLYFKSKAEVLVRMRGEVLRDYVVAFERAVAGDAPADERLVRGLARIDKAVRKHRAVLRVIRQASSGEETEQVWIQGRATLAVPLAEVIAEGCAEGSLSADDPHMTAHLVLALFDDLLYEAAVYKKPASSKKTLASGTRFMLRALGVSEARVAELVP